MEELGLTTLAEGKLMLTQLHHMFTQAKQFPLPVLAQTASAVLAGVAGVCTADALPSEKTLVDLLECSASAYFSV